MRNKIYRLTNSIVQTKYKHSTHKFISLNYKYKNRKRITNNKVKKKNKILFLELSDPFLENNQLVM